jgi:hypothetical protein
LQTQTEKRTLNKANLSLKIASDDAKNAKVAQLVEHDLAKVGVASSNLVFRSKAFFIEGFYFKRFITCSDGGTGRHAGLKIL